ncbi:phosphoglycerate dehydrogenase-like enzyme [Kineococcus radiotolerans]|uniref:Phosphoglycerate dehydrogenase-like enzyme n=1 Tax=Kineococcus radiotolerans TaxID=131568 RepID=A0A7W4THZ4_KINRA|nr:D-2-hydroxyacid dehydrogenase [Kineococcus radiotolerans]MBB2899260.1 phosphoglycerate dehydrogenase-like enzyme [Kineococcus radiotolerans]
MSGPSVLVTGPVSAAERSQLTAAAPGLRLTFQDRPGSDPAALAATDGLVGSPTLEDLSSAPRLRWVHSWAAGVDGVLVGGRLPHPFASGQVLLTSAKGNGAVPLAEHVVLLLLVLSRDFPRWQRAQSLRRWDRYEHGELFGSRVGIIGAGRAGREVELRARAFGMTVVGLRRHHTRAELEDLLATSDALVVTAPATAETVGMLGEAEFARCARRPYYVCVSRGGVADDDALLRALRSGQLAGAGLDAHAVEPLPPDSPFWAEPNVVITPHNAATTAATRRRGLEILEHNLAAFAAGGPPGDFRGVVDADGGY